MSVQPIGLDTALSRIQQIQSYQQQLLDPAADAATTSGSTATPAGSTTSSAATIGTSATGISATGASGASFATLLSELEAQGSGSSATGDLTGAATTPDTGSGLSALDALASTNPNLLSALSGTAATTGTGPATTATAGAPAAVQAMTSEADALVGQPYVWGGGHDGWGAQRGYDCSGFVSKVLHAAGYLSTPQDTQTLPQAAGIESGPGQYVTIYDRTDAGLGSDHVIINIDGQFYESGGESGAWGGGGGVEKIATPSAAYLASFNRQLHPAGL